MAKREPNVPVMIACTACNGAGEVELPQIYKDVLEVVPRGEYASTPSIHEAFPDISASHMNQRLTWLKSHGLVDSRRSTNRSNEWRRL